MSTKSIDRLKKNAWDGLCLLFLWHHFLGRQWPENCPNWKHETMCASTSAASSPDEEKPQGCGDTNGQVLTFDCAVLYPQLWISDSKRPYPWGLMCSARLQARTESRRSEKCDNDFIESYNDWFSQCWDKNDWCIASGPNRTLRNLPALHLFNQDESLH